MKTPTTKVTKSVTKPKPVYMVMVDNIGNVYTGNGRDAKRAFAEYRAQSKTGYGRAANESVCLFKDGEPIQFYNAATLNDSSYLDA